MLRRVVKRCFCGYSKRLPLCDGTHKSLGWSCREERRATVAFVAGPHNENLAERLASELSGVAVHTTSDTVLARRLIVIADGSSLAEVREMAARVEAVERRVVAIDLAVGLAAACFEDAEIATARGDDPIDLWKSVLAAISDQSLAPVAPRPLVPAFVSHAVADEPTVLPAVDYLRKHAKADLFVCADSIAAGDRWHDTIMGELERRSVLLWLLSRRSATSTFCSFEIGWAMAKNKRVVVVSMDGERPPAYAAHIQAIDIERRRATRPWLDHRETLSDAMLEALAEL